MRSHPILARPSLMGPVRALLAACLLIAGLDSFGICIEANGSLHAASLDHSCCDPPSAADASQRADSDEMSKAPAHDCAHAVADRTSGRPAGFRSAAPSPFTFPRAFAGADPAAPSAAALDAPMTSTRTRLALLDSSILRL